MEHFRTFGVHLRRPTLGHRRCTPLAAQPTVSVARAGGPPPAHPEGKPVRSGRSHGTEHVVPPLQGGLAVGSTRIGACPRTGGAPGTGRPSSRPRREARPCPSASSRYPQQKRLLTTDTSVPPSMKNAARCDTSCELQDTVNHRVFERKRHPRSRPGVRPTERRRRNIAPHRDALGIPRTRRRLVHRRGPRIPSRRGAARERLRSRPRQP